MNQIRASRVAPEKADFRPALVRVPFAGFLPEKRMAYNEKLRDPRWQRKRLEIMGRDGFACRKCGSETKTLNVHHEYYVAGNEPWEYPDDALITICEECHAAEHGITKPQMPVRVVITPMDDQLSSVLRAHPEAAYTLTDEQVALIGRSDLLESIELLSLIRAGREVGRGDITEKTGDYEFAVSCLAGIVKKLESRESLDELRRKFSE